MSRSVGEVFLFSSSTLDSDSTKDAATSAANAQKGNLLRGDKGAVRLCQRCFGVKEEEALLTERQLRTLACK